MNAWASLRTALMDSLAQKDGLDPQNQQLCEIRRMRWRIGPYRRENPAHERYEPLAPSGECRSQQGASAHVPSTARHSAVMSMAMPGGCGMAAASADVESRPRGPSYHETAVDSGHP